MEFYEYLRQVHPGCETRVIFVSGACWTAIAFTGPSGISA